MRLLFGEGVWDKLCLISELDASFQPFSAKFLEFVFFKKLTFPYIQSSHNLKIAQCFLSKTDVIHSASSCFPPWKSTPSSRAEFATIFLQSNEVLFKITRFHDNAWKIVCKCYWLIWSEGNVMIHGGFFSMLAQKNGSTFIFCTRVSSATPFPSGLMCW